MVNIYKRQRKNVEIVKHNGKRKKIIEAKKSKKEDEEKRL